MRVLLCLGTVTLLTVALGGCVAEGPAAGDPAGAQSSTASPTASSSDDPSNGATTDPTEAPTSAAPTGVGPRQGALRAADLLVFSQDALTPAMVRRIQELPGVRSVEPLSMGQVTIENRALNVVAVDPSTYRNYTPASSAELQEQWDRVAAGQVALVPRLERRLPLADGYLRLGSGRDAPRVVVGAYADQIPRVDAVVDTAVGAELGMQAGNALLVATYARRAPQAVRGPIEAIVGSRASVQILGPDLDISVQQTAYLVGAVADAVGVFNYTVLGGGRIAPDPAWVVSHIVTRRVPILGAVTCNRVIFPQLRAALREVVATGLAGAIHRDEYRGCYNARFIAGTTTLSNHSFGLALDLNVPGNQRGTAGEIDRGVVAIFERWGFTWGGRWSYTDPMHFEMNAIVRAR